MAAIEVLIKDSDRNVRDRLRRYTQSGKVLAMLMPYSDVEMRRYMAKDPWVLQETIQLLARDLDPEVRLNAAMRIGEAERTPESPKEEAQPKPKTSFALPMMFGAAALGSALVGAMTQAQTQVRVAMPSESLVEDAIEKVAEVSA